MRLLVTGGSGFIGRHAVRHFTSHGDVVLNVDKLTYAANPENIEGSTLVKLDICENEKLSNIIKEFKPEFIVHFAAETHVDNSIENCKDFVRSNVEGVMSILDVCRKHHVKLLHISTDEVYGPADSKAFTEDDKLNPMNPYSSTKAAGDLLVKSYRNTYGIDYLIVRPSNNYGPNQHQEKFIPKFLNCLRSGSQFPLYGSGEQIREWTYVEDTARILRSIINSDRIKWNETYNLSSGISSTNIDTAKKILDIYNRVNDKNLSIKDVILFSKDRPGHDKRYWISSKKLSSFVDTQYTDFQLGLEKTIIENVK